MAKSLHTPEYQHFCTLLVAARGAIGLTQADLAKRLYRPQSFVSKYESGERRLDVVEFVYICLALEIDPKTILSEIQSKVDSVTFFL